MFTTRWRSGNSQRCGVSASRSFGPMSGSLDISSKVRSITSRNSSADLNPLTGLSLTPSGLRDCRAALDEVLVQLLLDDVAHALGQLEHERAVARGVGPVAGGLDRVAELDPPLRRQRHGADRAE